MYDALTIGAIICSAVAFGLQNVPEKREKRRKILKLLTKVFVALALIGQAGSYSTGMKEMSGLKAQINAQGIPAVEWFHAQDTDTETFPLSSDPIGGSVEVLINGLIEPHDIYRVSGRSVTVSTRLSRSDQVTIRYRRVGAPK